MISNYKLTYNVDLVFCIDATGSMDHLIDTVKKNALNFYGDLVNVMKAKNKTINQVRVRVIAFRDYIADGEDAMLTSDFFTLPEQAKDLENCLSYIEADGGGDIPEDGLEALAYAIRSPWDSSSTKRRHVIVLWTNAPAHPLGFGKTSPNYPANMAASYEELSKWWGDPQHGGYMDQFAKRLALFAPQYESEHKNEDSVYTRIANEWDQAMLYPVDPEKGLLDIKYEVILDRIANTI